MSTTKPYAWSEHYDTVMEWNAGEPDVKLADAGWEHVLHVGVAVDKLDDFASAALATGLFGREDMWSDGDCWEQWGEPPVEAVVHVLLNVPHILDEDGPYWQAVMGWHHAGLLTVMGSHGIIACGSSLADWGDEDNTYPEWRA